MEEPLRSDRPEAGLAAWVEGGGNASRIDLPGDMESRRLIPFAKVGKEGLPGLLREVMDDLTELGVSFGAIRTAEGETLLGFYGTDPVTQAGDYVEKAGASTLRDLDSVTLGSSATADTVEYEDLFTGSASLTLLNAHTPTGPGTGWNANGNVRINPDTTSVYVTSSNYRFYLQDALSVDMGTYVEGLFLNPSTDTHSLGLICRNTVNTADAAAVVSFYWNTGVGYTCTVTGVDTVVVPQTSWPAGVYRLLRIEVLDDGSVEFKVNGHTIAKTLVGGLSAGTGNYVGAHLGFSSGTNANCPRLMDFRAGLLGSAASGVDSTALFNFLSTLVADLKRVGLFG